MTDSLGYLFYFYYHAVCGIFRKQNLILPPKNSCLFNTTFYLSESISKEWNHLFQSTSHNHSIPYTYYWIEFEKFFLKTMSILQFNYRNILHLGHDVVFSPKTEYIQIGETINLTVSLKDISLLDHNRAVIFVESKITKLDKTIISQSIDAIFLKGLNNDNIQKLKNSATYNTQDTSSFRYLSKRESQLMDSNVTRGSIFLPKNFGSQYGKISGDRNPIHTTPLLATAFGYPCAFVQGSAIVNFLFKYFIVEQKEPLDKLNIKFCRPICLGNTVTILSNSTAFELLDNNHQLLAFGSR